MTTLRGLALSVAHTGQYTAVTFDGDLVLTHLRGGPGEGLRLATAADSGPVLTDTPQRAAELLKSAEIWDVLELATLIVPRCPRDTLARALDFFGIVADGKSQAERVLMLFELLLATLQQVETPTLLHVARLASGLDWPLRSLFRQILEARTVSPLELGPLAQATPLGGWITDGTSPRRRKSDAPELEPPPVVPLDPDEVVGFLAADGLVAEALHGFEPRREQALMAQVVSEALNAGGQLLIEAGTGTGKSLAYLLPSAMRALANQQRVLVSTATTTLQDQLFEHDLPIVQHALDGVRATVLKGRNNYLCLRRWQTLLHATDLTHADRTLLIKTLFWLPRTATGDRAELHLSAGEEEAWSRLAAVTEACTPQRCVYHRIGVCFLARARRAAQESHVVIANHALLLSDLVSRSRVLPDYDVLIVDEAHHLEDEATQQLGWRVGERELLNRLERLWNPGISSSGAVPEALAFLRGALRPSLADAERAVLILAQAVRRFFEGLTRLVQDPELVGGDENTLRITPAVRAGSVWQELEQVWAEANEQIDTVAAAAADLVADLEGLPDASEAARDLGSELSGHNEYWRDIRRRLNACVHQPGSGSVYWISGGRFRSALLNAAPVDVSGLLRDRLFSTPETSVLVSATLAIDSSFAYIRRRLGLDEANAHALGSPFDYAHAALLYVPNDLPDPTQPGYQAVLERTIFDVVTRLNGRSLVLFTSRAHLKATYESLREKLAARGIALLAQGVDETSRTRLLENFRRGSRAVLFGTNAFWEGIDVVGNALSCVMVTRLPFAVPTDPVYAARAEQFDNPFAEFAVPQAVLRLKQGFGRLIRSRTDRGAVIVLDRRVVTRFYGQLFLRSLPECSVKQGPSARAGLEAAEWLASSEPMQMDLLAAVPG